MTQNKIQTIIARDNSGDKFDSTPIEFLLTELASNEGKVLVGLVHEALYGPARGMFAVIKPNNPTQLHTYLDSPSKDFSKQQNVVTKFWEKTQMATRLMILPFSWIEEHKLEVPEFESVIQFNTYLLEKIKQAPGMENPYYFRLGEIK